MSSFTQFVRGTLGAPAPAPVPMGQPRPVDPRPMMAFVAPDDSSTESSEGLTIEEIIEDTPSVKIVRGFFREVLASIRSEEERLFG
jgi:hypothetical protein